MKLRTFLYILGAMGAAYAMITLFVANRAVLMEHTFHFWGGIDLAVPPGWRLDLKVTALLGGIHDTRSPITADSTSPTLVVRGLVMMGGLEIKDRVDK